MPTTKLERHVPVHSPLGSTLSREADEVRNRVRRFLHDPLGRFLHDPLPADVSFQPVGWFPVVEIAENPTEFTVTAELPGLQRKDVRIDFENGALTIRGEKQEERKEGDKGRRYHLWERTYGAFQRSFTFPKAVDKKKVAAEFRHGVLTIHLPKAREEKTE